MQTKWCRNWVLTEVGRGKKGLKRKNESIGLFFLLGWKNSRIFADDLSTLIFNIIMKKIAVFLMFLALGWMPLKAQTSMAVPNGSFETWITNSGYSVSLFGSPIPVYDSFPTPTGWNFLSYPVNESISFFGLNITINTNLPLVKASRETGTVPAGSKALKLETFMLEDIVSPTVYTLASGALDSALTQTVFPSILSTGEVDLDHFMPIMSSMLTNMDSIESLLASLATMDVNYLISGGIALGSFEPSRLTGSYKYHSATTGDNGGVLLLGTRYNAVTQQREVVGGGANIGLTDIANFTPFTVDYVSLHEMEPSYPELAPDSLVVLILSSASSNIQQGSYLCVDNLLLWQDSSQVDQPDTCASVVGLTATPDIHEAVLNWSAAAAVGGYELECGLAGFAQGTGTQVALTNNTYTLTGLAANTAYDVYVRTVCSDTVYGDWNMLQFTTLPDTCSSIVGLTAVPDIHEAAISWNTTGTVASYELEYGPVGFTQGTGSLVSTANNTYSLSNLDANSSYDVYVRTVCTDTIYGDWGSLQFTTLPDTCAQVLNLEINTIVFDAPPQYVMEWWSYSTPDHWEVAYGVQGTDLAQGTMVTTNERSFNIYELEEAGALAPNTLYYFGVRSVCEDDVYGDWEFVEYLTPCAQVESIVVWDDSVTVTPDNRLEGYRVTWTDTNNTRWYVSVGNPSNPIPDHWNPGEEVSEPLWHLPALEPNHQYYVEVVPHCGEENVGEMKWVLFTTSAVGIQQVDVASLSVYPNPATGCCEVRLSSDEPAELQLFSLDGSLLQTLQSTGGSVRLELPSKGVFLLQAVTPSGKVTRKIVNK